MDHESAEIARLEGLLAGNPGSSAFPALAEANRRAGRFSEAERVARLGLERRPDHAAGRVALGLALLDLGRIDDARRELTRVLDGAADHPVAARAMAAAGVSMPRGDDGPSPLVGPETPALPQPTDPIPELAEVEDSEVDRAFETAAAQASEMLDANRVAEAAVRAIDLDRPEGVVVPVAASPFATRTVAELLDRQGHGGEAERIRESLEATAAPAPDSERDRILETLERWLVNLERRAR